MENGTATRAKFGTRECEVPFAYTRGSCAEIKRVACRSLPRFVPLFKCVYVRARALRIVRTKKLWLFFSFSSVGSPSFCPFFLACETRLSRLLVGFLYSRYFEDSIFYAERNMSDYSADVHIII